MHEQLDIFCDIRVFMDLIFFFFLNRILCLTAATFDRHKDKNRAPYSHSSRNTQHVIPSQVQDVSICVLSLYKRFYVSAMSLLFMLHYIYEICQYRKILLAEE